MTRKLPLCATCGASLRFPICQFRAVLEFKDYPGQPAVGWCDRHEGPNKELMEMMEPSSREEALAKIREIDLRGEGRVIRNKSTKRGDR